MYGVSESIRLEPAGADDLMAECERMEAELAAWLTRRAARLRGRRTAAVKVGAVASVLRPSLWQALIHIWATSPEAKARFSSEARAGLVSATSSMDPRTLMSLVDGLLEVSASAGAGPAAA